jgi:hypothetical protein
LRLSGRGTILVSRGPPASAIRIHKTLDSDTLHVPELRPYIGRTMEIVVEDAPPDRVAAAARMPEVLAEIARTRYPLAPGTPDSTELLREDRAR